MQRVFYAAEVISLTAGLFLFFCQGLVGFVPGMKDLGFISAILASAGCIVIITSIIMVLLVALFNSVSPASPTATVIGAAQPLAFCAFWFFAAIHLVYVAFALHVVDTSGRGGCSHGTIRHACSRRFSGYPQPSRGSGRGGRCGNGRRSSSLNTCA